MIIAGFRASRICRARFTLLVMLALLLGATARADAGDATNEALLRLLEVLQQRGSITTQEHDAIKALAEAPPPSVSGLAGRSLPTWRRGWRRRRRPSPRCRRPPPGRRRRW